MAIELNTDQPIQIYQDVRLIKGHRYSVSIGSRGEGMVGYVQVLDSNGNKLVFESFVAEDQWVITEWEFVAQTQSVRIGFGSSEAGANGPMVDYASLIDLSVEPIGRNTVGAGNMGEAQGGYKDEAPVGYEGMSPDVYEVKAPVYEEQAPMIETEAKSPAIPCPEPVIPIVEPFTAVKPAVQIMPQPAYGKEPIVIAPPITRVKPAVQLMPSTNYGPLPVAAVKPMSKRKCHPRRI
jgi:CBS domain-containing protein